MRTSRPRRFATIAAVFAALAMPVTVAIPEAEARAGKSSSSGSRGSRTVDAPAPTQTAPNTTNSSTALPGTASPGSTATRPSAATPATAPQSGGFFSRGGFGGMLMGGLIGAGIAGMLFGGGFLDGLGSLAGVLGFLLQAALIGFLVMLAVRFFRNRSRPAQDRHAYAGAGAGNGGGLENGPLHRDGQAGAYEPNRGGLAGAFGVKPVPQPVVREAADEIGIGGDDYAAFEKTLAAVQDAYSREDKAALAVLATPEMAANLGADIDDNVAHGVRNRIGNVRLLQGDLSEAWREGEAEYATVAMRFALTDVTEDRVSGKVVDGHPTEETEATEIWTFHRARSADAWKVSAIQQA